MPTQPRRLCPALGILLAGILTLASAVAQPPAPTGIVTVATAANFRPTLEQLCAQFRNTTAMQCRIAAGSTGQLYAQILRGAPFDLFLAADAERPAALIEAGRADADSHATYALGRLGAWSAGSTLAGISTLRQLAELDLRRLAIANPRLAPYGEAAMTALRNTGAEARLAPRLVLGQSVGQAFALAASGNAEVAIVALSLIRAAAGGSGFAISASLHPPIRQDLVIPRNAPNPGGGAALRRFLLSPAAAGVISAAGYLPPR